MARDTYSFCLYRESSTIFRGANVIQCDRWIRFDKESHKFAITKYGVDLLSPPVSKMDDTPSTLNKPNDHDVTMPDARPAIDDPSTGFKTSEDQVDQYSAKDPNLPKCQDIQQSDKDVVMVDMGSEKAEHKNYPRIPTDLDPVLRLNSDLVLPKTTSSPMVYHHSLISNTSKIKAMTDFDNSETKKPV